MQDLREAECEEFRIKKDGFDLSIRIELIQRRQREQELLIEIFDNRSKERFKLELRHSNFFKLNNKSGLFSLFWLKLMLSAGFKRLCEVDTLISGGKANSAFSLKVNLNLFLIKNEDLAIFNPVGVEQNLFLKIKKYNKTLDLQTVNLKEFAGILIEVSFEDGMALNLKLQVPRVIKTEKKIFKLETIRRVQEDIKKAFFEWKACGEQKVMNKSEPPSNQIRSYQNLIDKYFIDNQRLRQENQMVKKNLADFQSIFKQEFFSSECKEQKKEGLEPSNKD